jgi:hypothetical protein
MGPFPPFSLRSKENFQKLKKKRVAGVTPAALFDVQLIGWRQVGYRIPQIQAAKPPFIRVRQHTDQRTMHRRT